MPAPTLHDDSVRSALVARVREIKAGARPLWGKMSADQMFWHCNQALSSALGDVSLPGPKPPLPSGMIKFLLLNLPWWKGAPTLPGFRATEKYDLEKERQRCLDLVERFAARPLDAEWADHPSLGKFKGYEYSRLHAKHLNHHLTQFGV